MLAKVFHYDMGWDAKTLGYDGQRRQYIPAMIDDTQDSQVY